MVDDGYHTKSREFRTTVSGILLSSERVRGTHSQLFRYVSMDYVIVDIRKQDVLQIWVVIWVGVNRTATCSIEC